MTLDIIIPHYKEEENIIFPLLSSINNQQGINFKDLTVIIVNDGDDLKLNADFFKQFKNLRIKYFVKEHEGVSAARNLGISKSTADYIMFCDADDLFSDLLAFYNIFKTLTEHSADLAVAPFWIERAYLDTSLKIYNQSMVADNSLYLHSLIFNRQFILNNKILFPISLKIAEDKFFLTLCYSYDPKILQFTKPFYIWKCNPKSVTRHAMIENHNILSELIFLNASLIETLAEINELEIRKKVDLLPIRSYAFLYNSYLLLVGYPYKTTQKTADYMQEATISLIKNFNTFYNYAKEVSEKDILDIQTSCKEFRKTRSVLDESNLEKLSFDDWLDKIKKYSEQIK